ncbi:MAG TPA: M20/M25/M40 family metallo-hydrolase [Alphaproteobacteria bacterium]|nr:M20/M25/M40 family metallo-hydrolase [Alphaproteobacteria bacterium]
MKIRATALAAVVFFLCLGQSFGQQPTGQEDAQIRAEMGALAGEAMHGRKSGSPDELLAAQYLASQLHEIGVQPAGDNGGYIQDVKTAYQPRIGAPFPWNTRNVVGILPGRDEKLKTEIILLTAHMDHLGVRTLPDGTTAMFPGADDDASGCVAVLQLARALAQGERPRRTVVFAFFGSEETGQGLGNQAFLDHPPAPVKNIVANIAANLEFEMIGRSDPAVKPDELWLTGYERSDLGPELAKHGAKLVADPHPKEQFFTRSDNYWLAKRGIIAQTVSSYGMHTDYHRPGDDIAHIDFNHMEQAIQSLVGPVLWLANSDFRPQWVKGKKP